VNWSCVLPSPHGTGLACALSSRGTCNTANAARPKQRRRCDRLCGLTSTKSRRGPSGRAISTAKLGTAEAKIQQLQNELKVTMVDTVLFAEGGHALNAKGQQALDKIAPTLASLNGQQVVVQAFTDNVPIGGKLKARYPTNTDLTRRRSRTLPAEQGSPRVDPVRAGLRREPTRRKQRHAGGQGPEPARRDRDHEQSPSAVRRRIRGHLLKHASARAMPRDWRRPEPVRAYRVDGRERLSAPFPGRRYG